MKHTSTINIGMILATLLAVVWYGPKLGAILLLMGVGITFSITTIQKK